MAYATLGHQALVSARPKAGERTPNKLFLVGVGLAMTVSSIVLIEPAPVDAIVMGLIVLGVLSGILGFRGIRPMAAIPLAIFMVANVVSLYDPINRTRAFFYVFVTLYLCLSWVFFVGVLWTYGKRSMNLMIRTYTVAGMVCIVPALLSYFHVIGFQKMLLLYGRPKGTFKDPNVYGPFLIPIALFAVAGLISTRKGLKSALIHGGVVLISAVGIFLSYSRACWINMVLSLVAYFFFAFMFRPAGTPSPFPISRAIVSFVAMTLCVGLVLQIPEVRDMVSQRVTSNGLEGYDKDRFGTQKMAYATALERPLGIGPGQAELAFNYSTHSSYMRVLSENGFAGELGFVAFVLICLGRALYMGWKTTDPYWEKIFFIAAACILGHIVNSAVVDTLHWRHFWFLLALPWYTPNPVSERVYPYQG